MTQTIARGLLGAYLLFVGYSVWMPAQESKRITGLVEVLAQWTADAGLAPFREVAAAFEVLANVALFVPIGALLPLAVAGLRVWQITVAGAVLTLLIEGVQLLIPSRIPAVSDLIANTSGVPRCCAGVAGARLLAASRKRSATRLIA